MSEGSPGTAGDLRGRGEHMQKPHVWRPSVNSEDVVNLAGGGHFWGAEPLWGAATVAEDSRCLTSNAESRKVNLNL